MRVHAGESPTHTLWRSTSRSWGWNLRTSPICTAAALRVAADVPDSSSRNSRSRLEKWMEREGTSDIWHGHHSHGPNVLVRAIRARRRAEGVRV